MGNLPFRFLGIPITSRQIRSRDCIPLIEKIAKYLSVWRAKSLSYAGRVKLIKSIYYGNINFWCNALELPTGVITSLNSMLANFLWSTGNKKGISKVARINVTKPTNLGGIGLRDLGRLNKAFLMRHIWSIATDTNSLWVKWIPERYLRSDTIWSVKLHKRALGPS